MPSSQEMGQAYYPAPRGHTVCTVADLCVLLATIISSTYNNLWRSLKVIANDSTWYTTHDLLLVFHGNQVHILLTTVNFLLRLYAILVKILLSYSMFWRSDTVNITF